jgi:hypothetical protein
MSDQAFAIPASPPPDRLTVESHGSPSAALTELPAKSGIGRYLPSAKTLLWVGILAGLVMTLVGILTQSTSRQLGPLGIAGLCLFSLCTTAECTRRGISPFGTT